MQVVMQGYRGLTVLWSVYSDRLFTLGTVLVGLMAGAFLGTALLNP